MLFRLFSRPAVGALRGAYTLAKAAQLALETARREHLPLAFIATKENADRPEFYFGKDITRVVQVYGRRSSEADLEQISREQLVQLTLADDMNSLSGRNEDSPRFIDLRITRSDFKKYMESIRHVW
jgi:hypothetical protein